MKLVASSTTKENVHCVIEHDELVGYYVYAYENDQLTHDYLQGTLDVAKDFALEYFGVPLDAWRRIE